MDIFATVAEKRSLGIAETVCCCDSPNIPAYESGTGQFRGIMKLLKLFERTPVHRTYAAHGSPCSQGWAGVRHPLGARDALWDAPALWRSCLAPALRCPGTTSRRIRTETRWTRCTQVKTGFTHAIASWTRSLAGRRVLFLCGRFGHSFIDRQLYLPPGEKLRQVKHEARGERNAAPFRQTSRSPDRHFGEDRARGQRQACTMTPNPGPKRVTFA